MPMITPWSKKPASLLMWLACGWAGLAPMAHACDPAAINWQALAQRHDRNHDGRYSRAEFAQIADFAPYAWPKAFAGPRGHQRLFARLDRNQNGQIEEQEFFALYTWLPNPCAGWGQR